MFQFFFYFLRKKKDTSMCCTCVLSKFSTKVLFSFSTPVLSSKDFDFFCELSLGKVKVLIVAIFLCLDFKIFSFREREGIYFELA